MTENKLKNNFGLAAVLGAIGGAILFMILLALESLINDAPLIPADIWEFIVPVVMGALIGFGAVVYFLKAADQVRQPPLE